MRKFISRKLHKNTQNKERSPPTTLSPRPSRPGAFQYAPFSSPRSEIRLLEVLPARVEAPHEVHCTIKHVSLDSNAPYSAISYTWGPSTEPTAIIIGGRELKVPRSAYEALKGLRLPAHVPAGDSSRVFWIDAICIDQNNVPEKGEQILAMKEVYERATHVYIWLHVNPRDEPLRAINFLRFDPRSRVNQGVGREDVEAFNSLLCHSWFERTWTFQEAVLPRSLSIVYGSSNGDPRNTEIPWELLVTKAQSFVHPSGPQNISSPIAKFYSPGPDVLKVLGSILEIDKSRKKHASGETDGSLEEALFSTRGRAVTDARDAVYALLGIAKDEEKLSISPSYELSTQEVYQDCAVRVFQTTENVRLLSAAGLEHQNADRLPDLPSWVPDWTSTSNLNLLGSRISELSLQTPSGLQWRSAPTFPHPSILLLKGYILDAPKILSSPFPTAPTPSQAPDATHVNTQHGVNVASSGSTITISAEEFNYSHAMLSVLEESERLIASVLDTGGCFDNFSPWPAMDPADLKLDIERKIAIREGKAQLHNAASSQHEQACPALPFEEFIAAVTASVPRTKEQQAEERKPRADSLILHTQSPKTRYTDYKLTLSRLLGLHPDSATHKPEISRTLASEKDVEDYLMNPITQSSMPFAMPLHESLSYATRGRRFAVTLWGKMALVPAMATVGKDMIMLVEGARTPLLVRKAENAEKWLGSLEEGVVPLELVGECWVDGAMDGVDIERLISERGQTSVALV